MTPIVTVRKEGNYYTVYVNGQWAAVLNTKRAAEKEAELYRQQYAKAGK